MAITTPRFAPVWQFIKKHQTQVLLGAVVIILVSGVGFNMYSAQQHTRQQAAELRALAKKQASYTPAAPQTGGMGSDVSDARFQDVSDQTFVKPQCGKLTGRKGVVITDSNCNYRLRAFGDMDVAVVFVYENFNDSGAYAQLTDKNADNGASLASVNKYYAAQGARFGVKDPMQLRFSFYGPYQVSSPVLNLYYRDNGYELLKIYEQTAKDHDISGKQHDIVEYVLLDGAYGGMAFPGIHRAFTYNSAVVPTFAHETLHLFGASDKYNNNDCSTIGTNDPFGRYNGALPGGDIMCSNFSLTDSNINDITAREIGWQN